MLAQAWVESHPAFTTMVGDARKQDKAVAEVLTSSGVFVPHEGCGVPELQQFQRYL